MSERFSVSSFFWIYFNFFLVLFWAIWTITMRRNWMKKKEKIGKTHAQFLLQCLWLYSLEKRALNRYHVFHVYQIRPSHCSNWWVHFSTNNESRRSERGIRNLEREKQQCTHIQWMNEWMKEWKPEKIK